MGYNKENYFVKILDLDTTCRIVKFEVVNITTKIVEETHTLEYDVHGVDVLISSDSLEEIETKYTKWFLANEVEKQIRNDHNFKLHENGKT